jgi:hypothetical protein
MKEIIVYQMGKVASTAIVESIQAHGLDALQSHFLDITSFHNTVDRFSNPTLLTEEMEHMTGQLSQNLILYNAIRRAAIGNPLESSQDHGQVKVITLTRDPLDWFYSNLAQNFSSTEKWLNAWQEGRLGKKREIVPSLLADFLTEVFDCFTRVVPNMKEDYSNLMRDAFRSANMDDAGMADKGIYNIMTGLMRATFWYDKHFYPVFDLDVYSMAFDSDKGYLRHTEKNIDLLLLRYENLGKNIDTLGEFIGVESFSVVRSNITSEKSTGIFVQQARDLVEYPDEFTRLYTSSAYHKKFYSDK